MLLCDRCSDKANAEHPSNRGLPPPVIRRFSLQSEDPLKGDHNRVITYDLCAPCKEQLVKLVETFMTNYKPPRS